ncbi:MAG: NAD(P)H-hydrate dehydratase [Acidimicrobiales bacterium]
MLALLDEQRLPAPRGTKDRRGSVVIAGGPPECPGGVVLAANAALRAGAGRVVLAVHPAVAPHVAVAIPEALVLGWDPEDDPGAELSGRAADSGAALIGPGYASDISGAVPALVERLDAATVVLDAGALAATPPLAESERALVVAPNTSEAAELGGLDGDETDLALALGDDLHRPLAVRGPTTVITDGRGGLWSHDADASGLGTPGSGDVLMGALSGVLAQGLAPVHALAWAIAIHGRAGEVAERERPVGYLARDLVAALPAALAELGVARA